MTDTQLRSHRFFTYLEQHPEIMAYYPKRLLHITRRLYEDWETIQQEHPYSPWGEVYHRLLSPLAPWYIRWPLGLVTWVNTCSWRRQQTRRK